MTKRGDEHRRLPMAVRRLGVEPLAAPAASMGGRHVGLRPGLIDEHEALGIELLLAHPESMPLGRYVRGVVPFPALQRRKKITAGKSRPHLYQRRPFKPE
jgi:hypothetical protein